MPINLADLSPQQEVAAVYLGYYDRAADPFGFSFWTGTAYPNLLSDVQSEAEFAGATLVEQEEEVLARIAQDFARQPETKAEYPFFSTPSEATATGFLNQVYLNLFNRPIDTGVGSGAAFWTPLLLDAVNNPSTADFSVGEIILEIIKGAQEPDKSIVENKIEAAQDWTENAAANGIGTTSTNFVVQDVATGQFDIIDQEAYDAARAVIDGVDETPGSVAAAKQETQDFIAEYNTPDPVEPTTLELNSEDIASGGTFEADTVILNLDENPPNGLTINAGEVIIRAQNEAGPDPIVVDTSNWDVGKITVEDSEVDVLIDDIQGTDLAVEDQTDPNVTTEFNLDQQNAAGATQKTLGLNEVFGSVAITAENFGITGDGIETVDLVIEDPVGIESEVANLNVDGIQTLNLSGGNLGGAFSILGPLDAGLTTIDGSGAEAGLNLDISDSTEAVTMSGGEGDDFFMVGNTLGTGAAQDSFDGNGGEDTLHAEFTSSGTRRPEMEDIENFEMTFKADAKVDFSDVDDVDTIVINEVSGEANGVEIQDMDSTVKDLFIIGDVSQSDDRWEIGFDDQVDDEDDFDELTITWQNNTNESQEIDEFYLDSAEKVTVVFDGEQEMEFEDDFDLGFNLFDDGDEVTEELTIRNINDGDGIIDPQGSDVGTNNGSTDLDSGSANDEADDRGGMHETDRLETLTVETLDSGDLYLGVRTNQENTDPTGDGGGRSDDCCDVEGAFIADAQSLETISVSASSSGTIEMGGIGITEDYAPQDDDENSVDDSEDRESAKPAVRLDTVTVVSLGADIRMGTIDGKAEGNSRGATVSEFTIKAEDDAEICVNHVDVEDIQTMTIEIDDDAVVGIGNGYNRGLELEQQGETLTVSGRGELKGLWFEEEAFETMDFTGMSEQGVCVDFMNADVGSTVNGTEQDDAIRGGDGDDVLNGNGGYDVLVGWGGDDVINGGDDDDYLYGDDGEIDCDCDDYRYEGDSALVQMSDYGYGSSFSDAGNDTIDGGAGEDYIDGGQNAAKGPFGDLLTGGADNDTFFFDLDVSGAIITNQDTGKSTNNVGNGEVRQDVIFDFTPAGDTIKIEHPSFGGGDYKIGVFTGQFNQAAEIRGDNAGVVKVVLSVGDYDLQDGSFNFNADGNDVQVLFNDENGGTFGFADLNNQGAAFDEAEYEIGLVGVADKLGSFDTSDIVFV